MLNRQPKSPLLQLCLIALLLSNSSCNEPTKADLIIHNATIYSVNEQMETFEAMVIQDGKIIELGAEHQILNKYKSSSVIDAEKAFIYPGLIDAHSHFLGYGITSTQLDLIGTKSFNEVCERINEYAKQRDGEWITGRGWDQNDWDIQEFPTNDTFDILFPNLKIAITRVDGHAMLVSNNILSAAKIDATSRVNGGVVKVGSDGKPTGILIDEAMTLVDAVIPEPTEMEKVKALIKAEKDCFRVGLTTVTDAGLEKIEIDLIHQLHEEGDLKMRINAMYSATPEILENYQEIGYKTDHLTARSIKVYCDGALGSRGAGLIEPYSDDSLSNGFLITPADSLAQWAKMCYDAELQLAVHCIGTEGNRISLIEMSKVLGGTNDRRWRIEHAQVVHPEDRSLFGKFNIIPSMQPTHATSDMYWAEERLGSKRINWAYSLKSLMHENGMIPLGTDFPVESIDPINTFYAAVVRKDALGFPPSGFITDEALTREEALKGITIWAAMSSFDDDTRGSLEIGKFADFTILDNDLLQCDVDEILSTQVLQTFIGGELVYKK